MAVLHLHGSTSQIQPYDTLEIIAKTLGNGINCEDGLGGEAGQFAGSGSGASKRKAPGGRGGSAPGNILEKVAKALDSLSAAAPPPSSRCPCCKEIGHRAIVENQGGG